ncbi:MAG: Cna B-type domain-containing protein, partial [Eubacteriaceae bacterium]|nr:Cna B-type domain-containing protein [Eubacteriaceae bacterium]
MGPNTTRNSTRKKRMAFIGKLLVTVCLIVAFAFANFSTVNADAGDVPAHSKTATSNDDGTFKLELSVTGDAETNVQTASNVNILIIYDESSSMTSNNVGNTGRSRADHAEDVVHDFIDGLRQYQNASDPSNIQMALVGFGPNATTRQTWTSDLTGGNSGINRFFDDGVDGTITNSGTNSHGYSGNNGTNWQAAMSQAQTLLNSADSDPTFVILVTDGAPTAASGQTTINPAGNRPWTDFRVYYSAATEGARAIQTRNNTTLFGIYAYGTEADLLDDLIYYSNTGSHRVVNGYNISTATAQQHNFGSTETTDNYYNASDTAALTAAIEDIFQTIVNALGITSVTISDGTTDQVTTSTGDISDLLDVDESSYQYWLSIPVVNNQFQRVDLVSGETVTYNVRDNGNGTCTVTWGSNTLTVDGSVSSGQFKYEWTGKNALYNYDPPAARLVNSAVEWDLSSVGTLLDDVTYSVTFDVYPSQTTLDIVADIKNDPGENGAWGDLDSEVQKYIDVNGKLKTNTTATLSYVDTRTGASGSTTFTNPDPVQSEAVEQLAVSKEWENAMDGREAEPITLTVTRDGADQYTVKLGELIDPDDPESERKWTENVYISIGILRHVNDGEYTDSEGNKFEVLESGHEFTFKEPKDLGYYWELEVPTVRPMLIDGTITMLIKKDATHTNPGNAVEYTFAGSTYYVGSTGDATLTATNHRRARLNVTKAVDGEDSDPNQTFRFTMNVVDSKASEGSADNLNSDYWVWFSVWNGGYVDALVSGAQKEMKDGAWTGFYYAPSNTDIVVDLKAGDNLRFTNLPADSTYTITEDTLPANYAFTSSVLGAKTWDDEGHEITVPNSDADPNFSGAQTTAGKIVLTNTDYTVTYTNTYGLTDVEITKVWEDNGNQDGIRPTAASFKSYLVLKADGTDVTSANASKLEVTDNEDGTFTVKWTGLDRYADGKEIKYTVEETPIDDYTTTGSPADDHGTITNEHTPEVTSVKVVKVWNDSDNIGGIRPASINVQLKAGGENSGEAVALNADNGWTYTWENLPKYSAGVEIDYTADETAVPSGYSKSGPVKTTTDGVATFTVTNNYDPTPVSVDPPVQKVIENNADLYNKGDFTFTIVNTSAPEGVTAPMPENTSITNIEAYEKEGKTGFYEFGEITFTVPGTYEYTITESGSVDGVTNDPDGMDGKKITFTVTDDGTGKLVVTPTTDQVQLSFTNTYSASGKASITVSKAIAGAAWPSSKTLTLTLTGTGSAPMPETTTATLDAIGSVTFGEIEFNLSDAGKTYTYTIAEDGFGDGWTGSGSITATVVVTDKGDGTLEATVSYSPEDATITNTYKATGSATLEVTKAISGAAWPSGKTLTLTLAGTDSAPMPETTSVNLTAAGSVSFGPIAYTEADAGKTYTYTIDEDGFGDGWTGSGSITATVVVTDNGDGTLA